ncbi:MAG: hypothetical protein D6796_13140, partial [Caldilineae bacterium]
PLALPADHPFPADPSPAGDFEPLTLPESLTAGLRILCRREGVTPFMALLAAFAAALHRATGQTDLLVATPVANRLRPEVMGMAGYFNNLVPLRLDLSGDPPFADTLARVRETALAVYRHAGFPFQWLAELPGLAHVPLARGVFALHDARAERLALPGVAAHPLPLHSGATAFDLYLSLVEEEHTIGGQLQYRTALFRPETAAALGKYFQMVLAQVVARPALRLSELPPPPPPVRAGQPPPVATAAFVSPRDALEERLAQLWETVLGVEEPAGATDNFFERGGYSLAAVRLAAAIESAFGVDFSPAHVYQFPTVAAQADALRREGGLAVKGSLVVLRSGGDRPPVFLLPGNMGNVFADGGELARHLPPGRAVYGLQDGLHNPSGVAALAARYRREVQSVQAGGPYFVVGICSGAVVAFEMAHQWLSAGERVALLAMVEPSPFAAPGWRPYLRFAGDLLERVRARWGHHARQVSQLDALSRQHYTRMKMKVLANRWGLLRYRPPVYGGTLHLFLTAESRRLPSPNPYLHWQSRAAETRLHTIPGTHASITGKGEEVNRAHARALAEALARLAVW